MICKNALQVHQNISNSNWMVLITYKKNTIDVNSLTFLFFYLEFDSEISFKEIMFIKENI